MVKVRTISLASASSALLHAVGFVLFGFLLGFGEERAQLAHLFLVVVVDRLERVAQGGDKIVALGGHDA